MVGALGGAAVGAYGQRAAASTSSGPSGDRGAALGQVSNALDAAAQQSDADALSVVMDCSDGTTKPCCPPPSSLPTFEQGLGKYSASELNEATLTVFGEMSPTIGDDSKSEADAIVSTIVNRKKQIDTARSAYDAAYDAAHDKVQLQALTEAEARFKALAEESKTWSPAQKKVRLPVYQDARKQFNNLTAAQAAASAAEIAARSGEGGLNVAEDWVNPSVRGKDARTKKWKEVSLVDVVSKTRDGKAQYVGLAKGRKDYALYPKPTSESQRNCERWQIARKAVADAAVKGPTNKFIENRSNERGTRVRKPGEVRIRGNDFSADHM